jgi:hypothetical protein
MGGGTGARFAEPSRRDDLDNPHPDGWRSRPQRCSQGARGSGGAEYDDREKLQPGTSGPARPGLWRGRLEARWTRRRRSGACESRMIVFKTAAAAASASGLWRQENQRGTAMAGLVVRCRGVLMARADVRKPGVARSREQALLSPARMRGTGHTVLFFRLYNTAGDRGRPAHSEIFITLFSTDPSFLELAA